MDNRKQMGKNKEGVIFPVAPNLSEMSDAYLNFIEEVKADGEVTSSPVSSKLLVFRGVGIIEGPLLERDVSADKVQEPTDCFILFLNYSK